MTEVEARELFSPYHDGELDEPTRRALEALFAERPALKAEYDAFQTALGAMSSLRAPAPVDFTAAVEGQIRRRSQGRFYARRAPRWSQLTLSVVSLVTLLVTVFLYYYFASQ